MASSIVIFLLAFVAPQCAQESAMNHVTHAPNATNECSRESSKSSRSSRSSSRSSVHFQLPEEQLAELEQRRGRSRERGKRHRRRPSDTPFPSAKQRLEAMQELAEIELCEEEKKVKEEVEEEEKEERDKETITTAAAAAGVRAVASAATAAAEEIHTILKEPSMPTPAQDSEELAAFFAQTSSDFISIPVAALIGIFAFSRITFVVVFFEHYASTTCEEPLLVA